MVSLKSSPWPIQNTPIIKLFSKKKQNHMKGELINMTQVWDKRIFLCPTFASCLSINLSYFITELNIHHFYSLVEKSHVLLSSYLGPACLFKIKLAFILQSSLALRKSLTFLTLRHSWMRSNDVKLCAVEMRNAIHRNTLQLQVAKLGFKLNFCWVIDHSLSSSNGKKALIY